MKKIKLDSGKLKLKKEIIGNLLNKETMKHIVGGYGATEPVITCQCFTVGCASSPPACQSFDLTKGCPPSANCTNETFCGQKTCAIADTCYDYCTATCAGFPGC